MEMVAARATALTRRIGASMAKLDIRTVALLPGRKKGIESEPAKRRRPEVEAVRPSRER